MKYIYTILVLLVCCMHNDALAQQLIKVTGTVVDGSTANKETVSGVSISMNDKVIGSTDRFGKFTITVPGNATLSFKLLGYDPVSLNVNNRTEISVSLTESFANIDAVTVTAGYQTKAKALSTGAITTVSGKDLQGQPAGDVISLLQGRVAGLNIQNNTGAPGFRGSVTIRGISNINVSGSGNESFLTPTSPLYVIDGVPIDDNTEFSYGFQQAGPGVSPASQIPPEDIEEISVLKDAAATALYGSRGAYGVILITTKRGNSRIPVVRYNGSTFLSMVPKLRSVIGGRDERMLIIQQILAFDTSRNHAIDMINNTPFLSDSLNAYYNNSTNWQSYFYKPTYNQNHNLSISGGDVRFNYKANLGFYDENGIQENTGYSRYNLNMNMIYNPTDRFRLESQLNNSVQRQRMGSGNGLLNSGVANSAQASSLLPAPSLYSSVNSVLGALTTDDDNKVLTTAANVNLHYDLFKNFKASTYLNYNGTTGTKDNFSPAALNNNQALYYAYNDRSNTLYNRTQVQYVFSLKEKGEDAHTFNLFGFSELRSSFFKSDAVLSDRVVNDQLRGPLTKQTSYLSSKGGTTRYTDTRQVAFAGQFSYNYKQKYVLDFNYRLDGLSTNGPDAGYKTNPSISAKWNFDREAFMDNVSWLDFGDIRLSYGSNITPNGNIYQAYGKYFGGSQYNNSSTVINDLGFVPNLKLEPTQATTYNVGFDFSILKNKFTFTMDSYYKQNDNIFRDKRLSTSNSFGSIGSTEISNVNYGWEFQATARPLNTNSPFKWTLTGSFAINREVLAALPDGLREMIYSDPTYGQDIYYRLGINSLSNYLYNTKGVYSTNADVPVDPVTGLPYRVGNNGLLNYFRAGDPIFTDLDGNYVLNEYDRVIAGNSQPQITGGFFSLLQYKNWSLEVNTSFTLKRDILNNFMASQLGSFGSPGSMGAMVPPSEFDYWTQAGDVSVYGNPFDFQRASLLNPFRYNQTLFQEDGSYFKLNAVKVYYNFNQSLTQRYGMNRVSVNFTAFNLGYITKYSGPNPENVTALGRDYPSNYPLPKQFALGLNIEF
ncbi:SusC/RagA family TonB-linked outer membrane protein [Sphingobacterium lumbrici]|uniref:SusC/RagA family TonB-linked outer membrane protein n=1 Tax=Sphingobacterium lumbrici TaxID=2559600 RepID=UPI00112A660D|nr:SusC/RagA family TonB-linked outer membrane protein [Sphingobacterium lumbrici]